MNKTIITISSILQFIAAIMYIVVIRIVVLWANRETTIGMVFVFVTIAFTIQLLSIKLKEKYSSEVEIAENIMQKPKTNYGWIALGFFGVVVLVVIIYVMSIN